MEVNAFFIKNNNDFKSVWLRVHHVAKDDIELLHTVFSGLNPGSCAGLASGSDPELNPQPCFVVVYLFFLRLGHTISSG